MLRLGLGRLDWRPVMLGVWLPDLRSACSWSGLPIPLQHPHRADEGERNEKREAYKVATLCGGMTLSKAPRNTSVRSGRREDAAVRRVIMRQLVGDE